MKCHSINLCLWFCLLSNTSVALYLQYGGILLLVGFLFCCFFVFFLKAGYGVWFLFG